jgi:PAS domain S-box-containing protein
MTNKNDKRSVRQQEDTPARIAQEWQKTFDADLDAIWILDKDQIIIRCNKMARQIFNLSHDEMIGKHCCEIAHGAKLPIPECPALRVRTSLCRESMELQIGSRWFAVYVDPILDDDRHISGYVHIVSDITKKKQDEEALRKSEERFKAIFNSTFQFTGLMTPDGILIEANRSALDFAGISKEDVLNKPFWETHWWRGNEARVKQLKDGVKRSVNGEFVRYEVELQGAGTTTSIIDFSLKPVFDSDGKVTMLVPEGRDIADRKRLETKLLNNERKFELAFTNNPLLMTISEIATGILLEVNEAFIRETGYSRSELTGETSIKLGLIGPEDREMLARILQNSGKLAGSEVRLCRKDGSTFWVKYYGEFLTLDGKQYLLSLAENISERRKMETELQKAQKLESLGVLAGGIAHDFNNLLAGIFGYIELARSVSTDAQAKEYLDTTLTAMNRARALTLQLLTFAKGGAPIQKITPLAPFIEETVSFALSGSNISCRFDLTQNLRPCNIDKNQIGQVLDNIVINAVQAMPGGGAIEISAINLSLGEDEHPPLTKGDYVKVSIKDFGVGIPKEIMPRIFDPFYTTKIKGHGLGLATSYSIITRHGGCIDVESEPGKGSTFFVYLPASLVADTANTATVIRHKGAGTIIVMDDEKIVRETIQKMLELLGYTVVCKNDGRQALDFFINETRANRLFAAMVFDLTVPGGMGGIETVEAIRKLDKNVPVFMVSGYADNSVMKNPDKYGFTASLSKPFTIAELSEMLNKYVKT